MVETCQLVAGSCITGATLGLFGHVTYITSLWDSNISRFWNFKNPKISIFIVYKKRVVISEGEGSTENALKRKCPKGKWPSYKGKWPRWKIWQN